MRKTLFCSGLLLILGMYGFGQKAKQSPEVVDPDNRSSETGSVLNSGTRIEGQLQSTLDVKRTRVGDEVVLKTTKSIKQNGQTVVPKGSRLIGRITDVQQRTRSNGASRLGMIFDRIEGKDLSTPISASIVSISNVAANPAIVETADADIFATSSSSARASSTTSGSGSGSGLLGGVTNTVGGVTNTAGSLLNTTTHTAGMVTNSVGNTVGSTTGTLTRTVNGIQISNSVSGSAGTGTILSSGDKNIRLEKGTTIGLQLNSSARPR